MATDIPPEVVAFRPRGGSFALWVRLDEVLVTRDVDHARRIDETARSLGEGWRSGG